MPHIAMVAPDLAFFTGLSRPPRLSGIPQPLSSVRRKPGADVSSVDHSGLDPWAPSRRLLAYCGWHLQHLGLRLPDSTPRLVTPLQL